MVFDTLRGPAETQPRVQSPLRRDPATTPAGTSPPARRERMTRLSRIFAPRVVAHAHCDLPCGVYDPEQARIEAESVYRIIEK